MTQQAVKIGQTWRDKDRRSPNKVVVTALENGRVYYNRGTESIQLIHSSQLDRFVKRFRLEKDVEPVEEVAYVLMVNDGVQAVYLDRAKAEQDRDLLRDAEQVQRYTVESHVARFWHVEKATLIRSGSAS